jgi:hypothetical protein
MVFSRMVGANSIYHNYIKLDSVLGKNTRLSVRPASVLFISSFKGKVSQDFRI